MTCTNPIRTFFASVAAVLIVAATVTSGATPVAAAQPTTAAAINANPAAFEGVDVELTGKITRQIDDDDYEFEDTTGTIRIDIQSDVPAPPINVAMTLTGIFFSPEVNVYSWVANETGPGLPDEIVSATIGEINANPAGFDGKAVEVTGLVVSQRDADDYVFADTTGELDIDIQAGVPAPTVDTVITVVGIYFQPEIKVYAWTPEGGGTIPPPDPGPTPPSPGKVLAGGRVCFEVAGSPGDLALVNLTPIQADGPGFGLLVSSDIRVVPTSSSVNFAPGTKDPNVAAAPIGTDGKVCFANNSTSAVHIVADHLGSIEKDEYTTATASGAPARKIDTRGGSKVAPGTRTCFEVVGAPGDIALVNLTPIQADGPGFGLLVSSDLTNLPIASNVNFAPGTKDPNVAAAPIGTDGKVCFANNSTSAVHIVADHLGSIEKDEYTTATASGAPARKIDTRGGSKVAPGTRTCFEVVGAPGDIALVNLTPIQADGPGFGLLVSSDLTNLPIASNVNFAPGTKDPNVAAAPIGTDGKVCFANNSTSAVHIVADHLGSIEKDSYTTATASGAPARKIDTRSS